MVLCRFCCWCGSVGSIDEEQLTGRDERSKVWQWLLKKGLLFGFNVFQFYVDAIEAIDVDN